MSYFVFCIPLRVWSAGERFSLVWFTPLGVNIPQDLFWIDPASGAIRQPETV